MTPPDRQRQDEVPAAAVRRGDEALAGLCGRTPAQAVAAMAADSLTWTWGRGICGPAPGTGPAAAAPGELRLDRSGLDGSVVTVTRADPVIWVAAPMLTAVAWKIAAAELRLVPRDQRAAADLAGLAAAGELAGRALLKIDTAGGRLVYRVGRYLPDPDVYECSMPD